MNNGFDETIRFQVEGEEEVKVKDILLEVYNALKEKGYNPINQIVGYLISGDPTYITNYKNARSLIRKIDRDDIIEELLKNYLDSIK